MNDTALIVLAPTAPRPNLLGAAAKQLVLGRLAALECGTLRVHEGDTVQEFRGPTTGRVATIEVRDPFPFPPPFLPPGQDAVFLRPPEAGQSFA